jgi:hypothetical protein
VGFRIAGEGDVASIDLLDETFVAVPPAALVARLAGPGLWATWFPLLDREVFMDRGEKGVRWSVTGESAGSVEVWLEEVPRGTVVHWYVRTEVPSDAQARRLSAAYRRALKAGMFEVKDDAEAPQRDA